MEAALAAFVEGHLSKGRDMEAILSTADGSKKVADFLNEETKNLQIYLGSDESKVDDEDVVATLERKGDTTSSTMDLDDEEQGENQAAAAEEPEDNEDDDYAKSSKKVYKRVDEVPQASISSGSPPSRTQAARNNLDSDFDIVAAYLQNEFSTADADGKMALSIFSLFFFFFLLLTSHIFLFTLQNSSHNMTLSLTRLGTA